MDFDILNAGIVDVVSWWFWFKSYATTHNSFNVTRQNHWNWVLSHLVAEMYKINTKNELITPENVGLDTNFTSFE